MSETLASEAEPLKTGSAPNTATDAEPAKKESALWREIKGLFWVLLAVLLFHSFVAKPFYIPSESMMPGLLTGDRLVVSKYAYGWSWVSPSFHVWPEQKGRLFGRVPTPGDVVIVTPPGLKEDYIKRVVGVPGDTVEMRDGRLVLNGVPVRRQLLPPRNVPVDANAPCEVTRFPGRLAQQKDGSFGCSLPIVRETLPNGATYDTIDLGPGSPGDDYGPITVPANHVFLMGDNRDGSADSRFALENQGLGGPVPWENIGGRAEFITFSLDGSATWWNPISWVTSLRGGRAGNSLRTGV